MKLTDVSVEGEPIKQSIMVQRLEINFSEETKEFLLKLSQAEPVKHGSWTITETYDCEVGEIPHLICSECKSEPIAWSSKRFFNYCPNCGAKMDGDMK